MIIVFFGFGFISYNFFVYDNKFDDLLIRLVRLVYCFRFLLFKVWFLDNIIYIFRYLLESIMLSIIFKIEFIF